MPIHTTPNGNAVCRDGKYNTIINNDTYTQISLLTLTSLHTDEYLTQKRSQIIPFTAISSPHKKAKTTTNEKIQDTHSIAQTKMSKPTTDIFTSKNNKKSVKHKLAPITTHREANEITQNAIHTRIELLPNLSERKETIGKLDTKTKNKGLMWPTSYALKHDAAPLLSSYAIQGCPVDCGEDWTAERIENALNYGAHPSAKQPEALECLITEAETKVTNGFARIVTWKEIKHNIPPKLKISPIAMIPHKSRKFRGILDLSFHVKTNKSKNQNSVNESTTKLAKQESMTQLGQALKRIIATLADGQNKQKQFIYSKLDIKDGFWRMIVNTADAWNFCYVIPDKNNNKLNDNTKIVVPNILQMGWTESPPFFCAASETARDVIAQLLHTNLPPHPFEHRMLPKVDEQQRAITDLQNTINLFEVFVDDFIGCTDDSSAAHLTKLSRAMLHGIHSVFPPPSITGHNGGDPISEKKLDNLEGLWDHTKEILGWIIDGANYTIHLPKPKVDKIVRTLKKLSRAKRIAVLDFQKIAGTLLHAALGIPGGRGLFTQLWSALANHKKGWVTVTKNLKAIFSDFRWLFQQIANNPINVAQIVPSLPEKHGYTDSCKSAAGGIWILPTPTKRNRYVLWTVDFTPAIIQKFISHKITINDLELAGVLLGWLVLEHLLPSLHHAKIGIKCDNSATVAWARKFSARSLRAGHLLRALALRQQICKSSPLLVVHTPGAQNDMADIASRFSSTPKLNKSSPNLLTYFNTHFKQENSWEIFHLPSKLTSLVMSSLLDTQLTLESWRRLPGLVKSTGATGAVIQQASKSTRYLPEQTPSSETWSLQHSLQGSGVVTTAADIKSEFKESLMRYRPSARPSSWLATKAPCTGLQTHTTYKSKDA